MRTLRAIVVGVWKLVAWIGGLFAALLGALFGSLRWTPPEWVYGAQRQWTATAHWARRDPRKAAGLGVAVLAVALGVGSGWRWYLHRPKPVEVTFTVAAPPRTCYECEPPGNQPRPLTIKFAGSVAPLEKVGKTFDPDATGLSLRPAIEGSWRWADDKTLQFDPKSDWPVGQAYELEFARKGFVASHIRLKQYVAHFNSAPFSAKVAHTEFYQDPTTASDKKAVVTVNFSHPVATSSFEDAIELTLFEKLTDTQERLSGRPRFSVQYDKLHLNAYIHSEQLTVPSKEGRLAVQIKPGVHAERGGNHTTAALNDSVEVPGLFALKINSVSLDIARTQKDEPQQVLVLNTTHTVTEKQMVAHVKAWLLPEKNPDRQAQAEWQRGNPEDPDKPFAWSESAVTPQVLAVSQTLALDYSPNEQDHVTQHSFRYQADPGRYVLVRVEKGLQSFGGYLLGETEAQVQAVPEFPKELHIAHEGALLALSGSRKLTVFTRDLPGLRVQIGRLLPDQLQHVVTQTSGEFSRPQFGSASSFDDANLTERFVKTIALPHLPPGTAHYEALDLGEYLKKDGGDRRGVFFVKIEAYDPNAHKVLHEDNADNAGDNAGEQDGEQYGQVSDSRFIVVTDLGLLVKKGVDGAQDVFVQSIASGEPVSGASLQVIGKNGETVLKQMTDADGHAHFADLKSFKRERQPVLYLAQRNGDTAFLPIGREDRELDYSRFDIGGVRNAKDNHRLTAYLFSDRGIYRPGDEIRVGAVIKSPDWNQTLGGLPVRVMVTDPRGVQVKRETLRLSAAGLEEIHYATRDTAPTGEYTIAVALIKDEFRADPIGSIAVQVQEFQPDRLRMQAHLSSAAAQGWVSPEKLKAMVDLQNLFGTPAQNRRVTATMTLSPSAPTFAGYSDYQFLDPLAAKQGFTDTLTEAKTNDDGHAEFDLDLQRFARATYRLHLVAQGFEADGGRGVAAETTQLVSNLPYLVGWKADGDLAYVARDAQRSASFIAIDAAAQPTAAANLKLVRLERRYVSVLTQLDNGTYKYVSKLKEVVLDQKVFDVARDGARLALDTATPGDYSYILRDAADQAYARIDYTVAGAANLAAKMDKNAELKIVLDRKDYAPGDQISMQITAPYTGAGLITIERDKVYAWHWFKAKTTASVQHIQLPQGVEGNAYVTVSFVRDPSSPEIYASPLSYGVQPFSVALDRRTTQVTLQQPALVKPGERLAIRYSTDRPARIVLFAVDEGILQVARYKTPDPLGYFFQKRSLDVRTAQILDLILPEFAHDAALAAPGGDADSALGRHLNPFKRKTDKPVAYWSGVLDADRTEREVDYEVPEYFNGTLRIFAVAVSEATIGVADTRSTVRGDFVLSPNVPLMATPGDEFDVSVGVSNNVQGSGAQAQVEVTAEPSSHLELNGDKSRTIALAEQHEGVVHFRVKALEELGSATLRFHATLKGRANEHNATLSTTLSVRPATPYRVQLDTGSFTKRSIEVPVSADLFPQYRKLEAGIGVLPLTLAHGLSAYLGKYPYYCTEQLASMAMPAIVLQARPEFGEIKVSQGASLDTLVDELRQRQNNDGAYRYWGGGEHVEEFVSLYAQQVLLEAQDRGQNVPRDLLDRGNNYLRSIAGRDGDNLAQERNTAYAIYLLTRQGVVTANEAAALQTRLDDRYGAYHKESDWRTDITAAYLASAYRLMKQDALAERAIAKVKLGVLNTYDRYHSPMASDAELLYLLARHFPDRAKALPGDFLDALVQRVQRGEYSSLSAAETILALDQYATTVGTQAAGKLSIVERSDAGEERPLALPDGLLPKVEFDTAASKLRFANDADQRTFYMIERAGFDRQPPKTAVTQGFEIIREYTDTAGKVVDKAKLGEELVVHVKFRTVKHDPIGDGVLVDLLPAGFELVMPRAEPKAQTMQTASATDAQTDGAESEEGGAGGGNGDCGCGFLWSHPQNFPDYADLREDRVVAYGAIGSDVQELTYRIKATNAGRYVVPPAYGESMYDRTVQARSTSGSVTVTVP